MKANQVNSTSLGYKRGNTTNLQGESKICICMPGEIEGFWNCRFADGSIIKEVIEDDITFFNNFNKQV